MSMPYDDTTRQQPPTYIVMESNLLIAEDISGALQAFGPCKVIRITDPAELDLLVAKDIVVKAAILEMHFEQALNMALSDTFVLRGAKIILTVGESDENAVENHGWSMLVRPFTEDMLHAALTSAQRAA